MKSFLTFFGGEGGGGVEGRLDMCASSPRCIMRVNVNFVAGFITIQNNLILA